jgi:hypothetical protein
VKGQARKKHGTGSGIGFQGDGSDVKSGFIRPKIEIMISLLQIFRREEIAGVTGLGGIIPCIDYRSTMLMTQFGFASASTDIDQIVPGGWDHKPKIDIGAIFRIAVLKGKVATPEVELVIPINPCSIEDHIIRA